MIMVGGFCPVLFLYRHAFSYAVVSIRQEAPVSGSRAWDGDHIKTSFV